MAVSTAQLGDMCITTQVVSASDTKAVVPGINTLPPDQNWANVVPEKKVRGAKALSAVLILIGVLQLSLGASLCMAENTHPSLVVRSGVYIWGGLVFIATGVSTVVFATKESVISIKACLISHVINVTVATIGIILYILQIYTETQGCWVKVRDQGRSNKCVSVNLSATTEFHDYSYYHSEMDGSYVSALRLAVNSMVLFYILVGLIISNCVILLKWKSLKEAKYSLL